MSTIARVDIDASVRQALAEDLAPTALWSLLLDVFERRAAQRSPAMVRQQWESDRFVQPCAIDQRTLNTLDAHLLAAAANFEALELSPLAPLAACSSVALTSQNRIVSTARGSEIVSDPTNVLALECARRLRSAPGAVVKLTTSHRCVRAQPVPKRPGFAAHFRMFCLASAAHERKDHGFVAEALIEHIRTHIGALDRLEKHGYQFPDRSLRLLATPERRHIAERIASAVPEIPATLQTLEHRYYDGLRFMLDAGTPDGNPVPLIDGGAFDWLGKLTDNRRMVFVASAMGSQLAALLFRRVALIA
ncbi:hypothetical protein JM946_21370 [Steroidobacter sp. S1-65]|uniref:Uncharacterized protein n=1 Tax=Steroidobacter gossypii TaxID=2805490 RepID=A0ABS1X234_9GAMM|nr:hypothetical protein [Steroidobacter gossypii]MBM0107296.1 hypothetical protein [Steroidobacter gossypii]